jgi:hypothetical protein
LISSSLIDPATTMSATRERKRRRKSASPLSDAAASPSAATKVAKVATSPGDEAITPGEEQPAAEPELTEEDISAWNTFCEEYHDSEPSASFDSSARRVDHPLRQSSSSSRSSSSGVFCSYMS